MYTSYIINIVLFLILMNLLSYFYFQYKHPFWSRSPVMHYYTYRRNEGVLYKKRDPYNEMVTQRNADETWIHIDTNNTKHISMFSHLLDHQYMYDNEFKYKYNAKFIQWCLNTPYKHFLSLENTNRKIWSVLLKKKDKIIASITSRPLLIHINGRSCKSFYVDYLCINKEYRGQGLAPKMILKVEPSVWAENQYCLEKKPYDYGNFNMYIFKKDGFQLPFRYICKYSYYYIHLQDLHLSHHKIENKRKDNYLFIKINKDNISQAFSFFTEIIQSYKMYQIMNLSEFTYLFLNEIMNSYMLIHKKSQQVVGFSSFYDSQMISIDKEESTCELYYIFTKEKEDLYTLCQLTYKEVQKLHYSYIFTTNVMMNHIFLEKDQWNYITDCYYHLYNYYAYTIKTSQCALVII